MFTTVDYSADLGSLLPIEQLYPPLFTLSGARQSIRKMMCARHLESRLLKIELNFYLPRYGIRQVLS